MKKLAALLILIPVFAFCGEPAKHPIDAHVSRCMEKDPSTHGTIACINEGAEKWDAELNRAYGELMKLLDRDGKAKLRSAQREWITFRDRHYDFIDAFYSKLSGTMYLQIRAADRMETIRKRALALASYIDLLLH